MCYVEHVTSGLADDLDLLRGAARSEGYSLLDRHADEWAAGLQRFNHPGEILLAARLSGTLVRVGGVARDPVTPGALRMRRFYTHPAFRRRGVARRLALVALGHPSLAGRVVLGNAGIAQAPACSEALGVVGDPRDGHKHRRCLAGVPGTG